MGTVLHENNSHDNRLDLANDGSLAAETGNQFDTGGPNTAPDID